MADVELRELSTVTIEDINPGVAITGFAGKEEWNQFSILLCKKLFPGEARPRLLGGGFGAPPSDDYYRARMKAPDLFTLVTRTRASARKHLKQYVSAHNQVVTITQPRPDMIPENLKTANRKSSVGFTLDTGLYLTGRGIVATQHTDFCAYTSGERWVRFRSTEFNPEPQQDLGWITEASMLSWLGTRRAALLRTVQAGRMSSR